ncbi:MAG: prepilin-type N-terminal cleavage/methylation domain-containing protein [Candidatus Omnitrophota bacterium]
MRKRAFSLIEMALAVAIFTIVGQGMLSIFWQGAKVTYLNQQRAIAYNLAREKMEEEYKILPWPPNPVPVNEARAVVDPVLFPGYEREVIITVPYFGYNGLCLIRVNVWWDSGRQTSYLETLKADY